MERYLDHLPVLCGGRCHSFWIFFCRHCDRAVLLLARQRFKTLPITRRRNFEDNGMGATM